LFAGALARELSQLAVEASSYKQSAYAESTKATYRTHKNSYLRFCLYFGLVPVPAVQNTLKTYVAFLARSIKPSGINSYLNIVRILHLESGLPNPLDKNFELNLIKRGVARQLGTPAVQKLPINVAILRSLYLHFDMTLGLDSAFWAALILGFFGMLRKSSLLLKNARLDPASGLRRCDVVNLCVDSFVLIVRRTKTIQFGERVLQIPYVSCLDSRICPVRALLRHLTLSRLSPDHSLFAYISGGRSFVLCLSEFVQKLRVGLKKIGLNPAEYSGHSLRRGGCSLGFSAGLSVFDLKTRGDWRSSAVERYIQVPSDQIFASARAMVQCAAQAGGGI
jgi:hypothetical protein